MFFTSNTDGRNVCYAERMTEDDTWGQRTAFTLALPDNRFDPIDVGPGETDVFFFRIQDPDADRKVYSAKLNGTDRLDEAPIAELDTPEKELDIWVSNDLKTLFYVVEVDGDRNIYISSR